MVKKVKNSIELRLIRGNERQISNHTKPDVESYKRLVERGGLEEKTVKPGLLISRVDKPVTLKYGEDEIRLSPRGQEKVADVNKLENPLPNGLYLKLLVKSAHKK